MRDEIKVSEAVLGQTPDNGVEYGFVAKAIGDYRRVPLSKEHSDFIRSERKRVSENEEVLDRYRASGQLL